jgi:alpha-N-arabinofuranosidase
MTYQNPILPGFYPDPSVCRVGNDYYLVNSSFEYFPGVPIFHSRDLINWRQIGHALTRPSQLPLKASKCSNGIYAPTIRHHAGRFYMATTNMIENVGFRNFFVHTDDPAGEWSEPAWVEQGGIDPSLYFDADGTAYWTGNGTGWSAVRGVYQARVDITTGKLLTDTTFLWGGTGGSYPEGPHLFKRGAYYYLTVAEGGTADCHMVTCARSLQPFGPFEPCPYNPILTHRSLMNPIQATGHADLFADHEGNWWAVFLGIRYAEHGFHNLGRETFLAPVVWTPDDWPMVNGGEKVATTMHLAQGLPAAPPPSFSGIDNFSEERLALPWVFLRNPKDEDWSLEKRPGWLWLRCSPVGMRDLDSPAFVGRRQLHFDCRAVTLVDFEPGSSEEEAGLVALLDNAHHAQIAVTLRDGKRVAILRRVVGDMVAETSSFPLPEGPVELAIEADRREYRFGVKIPGREPCVLGAHPLRYLSTEVAGGYTGVMLGMYASANAGCSQGGAYFDWFKYES